MCALGKSCSLSGWYTWGKEKLNTNSYPEYECQSFQIDCTLLGMARNLTAQMSLEK